MGPGLYRDRRSMRREKGLQLSLDEREVLGVAARAGRVPPQRRNRDEGDLADDRLSYLASPTGK